MMCVNRRTWATRDINRRGNEELVRRDLSRDIAAKVWSCREARVRACVRNLTILVLAGSVTFSFSFFSFFFFLCKLENDA